MSWIIKPDGPNSAHTIYAKEGGDVLGHILFDRNHRPNGWLIGFDKTPLLNHECFTLDAAVGYVTGVERALATSTETVGTIVAAIRRVVRALQVPRNRFGKLEPDANQYQILAPLMQAVKAPHGGADIVDQACMILQGAIGDEPQPIEHVLAVDMSGQRKRASK
jgi:hypothetical protein